MRPIMKRQSNIIDAIFTQSDPRWAQLLAHNAAYDGVFYYSVKTTGVYCLPSCKSLPALPQNVAFHRTRADAIKAGFRACKRCKPDQLKRKKGNQTMTIQEQLPYAVADTSLGQVVVAQGNQGVRAIMIGRTFENVLYALHTGLPDAHIKHDPNLQGLADQVAQHIENPQSELSIKLDMRGNDFQMKVWHALREIPIGTTVTYRELADTIGVPDAARAVGEACAANVIAVAIPCHRVVKSDGSISGYRWGVETKQRLLEMEGARLNVGAS